MLSTVMYVDLKLQPNPRAWLGAVHPGNKGSLEFHPAALLLWGKTYHSRFSKYHLTSLVRF